MLQIEKFGETDSGDKERKKDKKTKCTDLYSVLYSPLLWHFPHYKIKVNFSGVCITHSQTWLQNGMENENEIGIIIFTIRPF